MGISIVQDCDGCGRGRALPQGNLEHEKRSGGWRELEHGNRRATLCNACLGRLLTDLENRRPFAYRHHESTQ